jgi:hypothetical protein
MELKDFVKKTLRDLTEAIDESGVELKKKVVLTNTLLRANGKGNYGLIDFDLAVDAKASAKRDASGGLKISVVEAKLGGHGETISSSTSRIHFTVEADLNSFEAQLDAQKADTEGNKQ